MELQQILTISYEFANTTKQLLSNYYLLSTPRKRFSLSDSKKNCCDLDIWFISKCSSFNSYLFIYLTLQCH